MPTAEYILKGLNSKTITLADLKKAPNTYLSIAELYRWLNVTKDSCPQLVKYIISNCLGDVYGEGHACFKIALNKDNKPMYYLVERAVPFFLEKHKENLIRFGIPQKTIKLVQNRFTPIKTDEKFFTLSKLLIQLKKDRNTYKNVDLTRKTIEALLRETYLDENNAEKPVCRYTLHDSKSCLSVDRNAIPAFLQKFGKTFHFYEDFIQEVQETKKLPDLNDQLISINDFSRYSQSPDGFMHWFCQMAKTFFKKDFEGKEASLVEIKTDYMRKTICLKKEKAADFVLNNKDLLLVHGFNPDFLRKIEKTGFDASKISYPLSKKIVTFPKNFTFPLLLLNQLTKILNKSTTFIFPFKDFIINNCLEETFDFHLENGKTIKAPIFSYYKGFTSDPTLYTYEQAIPDFVNNHFNELLKFGCPFNALNSLLAKKNCSFTTQNNLWSQKEFYLHSFSPLSNDEFNEVISRHLDETFYMQNECKEFKKMPVFIQTRSRTTPIKIMTAALPSFLQKTKEELRLSNLDCQRLIHLASLNEIPPIVKVENFIADLNVPAKNKVKFIKLLNNPKNKMIFHPNEDGSLNPVVVFGYSRNKEFGIHLGIYQNAIPVFLTHFKKDLLKLKVLPKKINDIKRKYEMITNTTPQPTLISKQKTFQRIQEEKQRS